MRGETPAMLRGKFRLFQTQYVAFFLNMTEQLYLYYSGLHIKLEFKILLT